jgi:hypothetical protein
MEGRFIKDFTILLAFIMILVFAYQDYRFHKTEQQYAEQPNRKMGLSPTLKDQIERIDASIKDRKQFLFTAYRDPLEQNLIVKTKIDLEKQWKDMVNAMVRVTAIYSVNGQKAASISYAGKSHYIRVGQKFGPGEGFLSGGELVDVRDDRIVYRQNGNTASLPLRGLPPKPKELTGQKTTVEQNW